MANIFFSAIFFLPVSTTMFFQAAKVLPYELHSPPGSSALWQGHQWWAITCPQDEGLVLGRWASQGVLRAQMSLATWTTKYQKASSRSIFEEAQRKNSELKHLVFRCSSSDDILHIYFLRWKGFYERRKILPFSNKTLFFCLLRENWNTSEGNVVPESVCSSWVSVR